MINNDLDKFKSPLYIHHEGKEIGYIYNIVNTYIISIDGTDYKYLYVDYNNQWSTIYNKYKFKQNISFILGNIHFYNIQKYSEKKSLT